MESAGLPGDIPCIVKDPHMSPGFGRERAAPVAASARGNSDSSRPILLTGRLGTLNLVARPGCNWRLKRSVEVTKDN